MIRLVVCGKIKEKWMSQGIQEYVKRLGPYTKFEIVEVNDEKTDAHNSEALNQAIIQKEGERLLKAIGEQDFVILLDLHGKSLSSEQLASCIDETFIRHSTITFVIGGSLGVSEGLRKRANVAWSLSRNTFPHTLCRLLVVEQIYRSFKILKHEPYHK